MLIHLRKPRAAHEGASPGVCLSYVFWKLRDLAGQNRGLFAEDGSIIARLVEVDALEDQLIGGAHATLAETLLVRAAPAAADVPQWLPAPRERFVATLQSISAQRSGGSICLWPQAPGAISDVPSLLSFMRSHGESAAPGGRLSGSSWRFLLDPVGMLTLSMLPHAADHLARLFSTLGGHPDVMAVLLCGWEADPQSAAVKRLPLDDAEASRLVRSLHRKWCPAEVPVVLLDDRFDSQVAMMRTYAES